MVKVKILNTAAVLLAAVMLTACADTETGMTTDDLKATSALRVTSQDIENGVWDPNIASVSGAANMSPQLEIAEADGAESYCIYMLDESADNWLHWYVPELKKCELERGEETDGAMYKGPYPPNGKEHTYTVFVFALKNTPDGGFPNSFDAPFMPASELFEKHLDISGGESGNVISYGYVSGKYAAK